MGDTYESAITVNLHEKISAWFLGPQAENFDLLQELFNGVLQAQADERRKYHPEDDKFVTPEVQESIAFQENRDKLCNAVTALTLMLNKYSVPFFSPRYAGHMSMEMSLPGIMGYLATMLFNPNNVAFEASPITTLLEIECGNQLCEMLGYSLNGDIKPWGHIPCDGTVANMESMWAARNLKFYPLALRSAMDSGGPLEFIADTFKVSKCAETEDRTLLKDFENWDLLNIRPEVILGLGDRLHHEYGISPKYLDAALRDYIVQTQSKDAVQSKWGITKPPQYLISSTKHYSWPKSAALVGIGSDNCVDIPVDRNARLKVDELDRKLQKHFDDKQAVYAVVCIIGSTEEGAVDPLDEVIALRNKWQKRGLSFLVHADAAWGGYFASMLMTKDKVPVMRAPVPDREFVPGVSMRASTIRQFQALKNADSITIDPHKAGYILYPAGGLCYRDGRMRFLLTWTAPYIHGADDGESIGIYGIEGSKPGASAAAVFLHNEVTGLHEEGHGALLKEVTFTCRRLSAHWAAMSDKTTEFIVVPFNPFPSEADTGAWDSQMIEGEKKYLREQVLPKTNRELVQDKTAMETICLLGSDLNINAFACNFRLKDENGKLVDNTDVEEANYLNNRIFDRFALTSTKELPADTPMYLSSTVFALKDYGECVQTFQKRLGLETDSKQDLFVLRNVVMSPFQTAGQFMVKLANIFQDVLQEEVQNVVARNQITPQKHKFIIQGAEKLFLIYRPLFQWGNSRFQLILSVEIPDDVRSSYLTARKDSPQSVFYVDTKNKHTLAEIIETKSFEGSIHGETFTADCKITNIKVVKQRPLNSMYRDPEYPKKYMPFYLYGTPNDMHIDHMLLRFPNGQLSANSVTLKLDGATLTAEQLERGVIVCINRHEETMQPFDKESTEDFFARGRSFKAVVYKDEKDASAHGPNLFQPSDATELGFGTLTLGESLHIDVKDLNQNDFVDDKRDIGDTTTKEASRSVKNEWRELVSRHMAKAPAQTPGPAVPMDYIM